VQGAAGRSFEGSGIGLALVHDLVRLHGGEVSVESREGVGSTFRVSLPLGREHLPEYRIVDAGEAPSVGGRASGFVAEALRWLPGDADDVAGEPGIIKDAAGDDLAPPPRRHGHVLLADDNADLRDYVGRLLRNRGYTVEAVGDGDAALDAAQANRPDLLLTDVMMPKRDGFSLLAAIRADPGLSDLPVVMLSARAGEEAQVEGLDAGADDYLAKPFSARELLARVSANLDMARIRRQAAEAIRASEAKLRIEREFLASVLAKAPVGISIVDGEGRMSMLNERAVELLGHRFLPKDADGFSGYRAIHPDGSPYAVDEYPTVRAARGERVDGERMIYLRSGAGDPAGADAGERVVLEVDAVPIRDADGRSAGAVTVFVDAEARERAEEELRRRVDEAIAAGEAAREELHQLQKLETIGQLTGGVAHDFNNLLTPIVGALDLLRRRYSLDDRAVRMIEVAQQSAERARVLISRLLTFARRQHLEARPVNLGELVSGMSDLIERSLGVQIAVVYDIQADAASVMADPNQLELAILNLCVNARDAMPAGGQLSITVREQAAGGLAAPSAGYVELAVADTGVGMEPDTLKRAIEPFYTTKGVGKGTGLGLSMVHGLAAQSGGALQLDSAPGRGTTARILLPALTADTTAAPAAPAPRSAAPLAMEPLRILLVDDEELVRAGTAEMLEALGHSVIQAASGPAALKALKTMDCDLMVADYLMPAMTGVELIEHARALIPTLPVLLVTGYTGLHLKLDDRLTRLGKPFGEAELAAAVAGAMAGSQ
jgi:PAS domain S-box-containing protein